MEILTKPSKWKTKKEEKSQLKSKRCFATKTFKVLANFFPFALVFFRSFSVFSFSAFYLCFAFEWYFGRSIRIWWFVSVGILVSMFHLGRWTLNTIRTHTYTYTHTHMLTYSTADHFLLVTFLFISPILLARFFAFVIRNSPKWVKTLSELLFLNALPSDIML